LKFTLFTAPLAVEPVTANALAAFVPVKFTVDVSAAAVLANVTFRLDAVTAPVPLITYALLVPSDPLAVMFTV
jgi:hypothetical protein